MPKKSASQSSRLAIPMTDLPKLRTFALPLADGFDLSVKLTFRFPDDTHCQGIAVQKASNCFFASLKVLGPEAILTARKITCFDWKYLAKMFGPIVKQLIHAPDGTKITLEFGTAKHGQNYQGQVHGEILSMEQCSPDVTAESLHDAWSIAQGIGANSLSCRDDAEADAFEAGLKKYKNLRDADVKRKGNKFSCGDYPEHLFGYLFQLRHADPWQLPKLNNGPTTAPAKLARPTKNSPPSESSSKSNQPAVYEELSTFLNQLTRGKLKSRALPNTSLGRQWYVPASSSKTSDIEFVRLSWKGDELYIEMQPLREHVGLSSATPKNLRKQLGAGADGIASSRLTSKKLESIRAIVTEVFEWFDKSFVGVKPTPNYPIQPMGSYLFEQHSPLNAKRNRNSVSYEEDDEEGSSLDYDSFANWDSVSKPFALRLQSTIGPGPWKRAEVSLRIKLFDWDETSNAVIHWYASAKKSKKREGWRIKNFIKTKEKQSDFDSEVVCITPNSFPASLVVGKAYRCKGRIGRKYTGYLRIIDESNEEYWYPETFFEW